MHPGKLDFQIDPACGRLLRFLKRDAQRREHVLSLPGQIERRLRRDVHGLCQNVRSVIQRIFHVIRRDLFCLAGFHGVMQGCILFGECLGIPRCATIGSNLSSSTD